MRILALLLSSGILALFLLGASAEAQELGDPAADWHQIREKAANTSFVSLAGSPEDDQGKLRERATSLLKRLLDQPSDEQMSSVVTFKSMPKLANLVLLPLSPKSLKDRLTVR